MKNKLTAKAHKHSKSADRESRSQSIEKDDSENEVLPSRQREFTLPNSSPRKRKVRVRTQSQTPSNDIPRLNVPKKLFQEKAFDSLVNEVTPSIKREPTFEGSAKIKNPKAKTGRKTSAKEVPSPFKASFENEENECIAKVEKAHSETKDQSFSTSKTHLERQWSPQGNPPTTPYALNRPKRNRIPPLAYWRGEHRSFRTLINGDIVLVDFHIPEYTEEPQRKKRKRSEKKNVKIIKTETDED